ncbi:MAG TPA: LysR family transcriptional regulator [Anaeromyxobacter sp.]
MHALDWNDLRYLLAAEQTGSFAAAARRLRVDPATVGRRMRSLEDAVGTPLLERTPGSLTLTASGGRALHAAEIMYEAALTFERTVDAGRPEISGVLRITATDALASRILAPRIPELAVRHPGLAVELHVGNERLSLSRREADVAVRLSRPVEPAVAARRAGTIGFALYASREYLRARGAFTEATLRDHALLGYDRPLAAASTPLGWIDELRGGRVVLRSNGAFSLLAATAAGLGVAALPCFLGDAEPGLVRALPELREREIWLAVHGDLRRSARARVGLEFLAAVLSSEAARLGGRRDPAALPRAPRRGRGR